MCEGKKKIVQGTSSSQPMGGAEMAGCCVTSWGAGGDGRLGIRNMRSQKSSSDDDVERMKPLWKQRGANHSVACTARFIISLLGCGQVVRR